MCCIQVIKTKVLFKKGEIYTMKSLICATRYSHSCVKSFMLSIPKFIIFQWPSHPGVARLMRRAVGASPSPELLRWFSFSAD